MKLARATGTAPYAICGCGYQTLKRMALTTRLANVDGVNQHFLKMRGDHFLQSIRHLSQSINLFLDVDDVHNGISKKVALKMWHGDGLSVQKIAASLDFPGKSHPRKEQTVVEYILDAAKEGCRIDWTRFCEEIGLTRELSTDIQGAILKVGSRDRLKPIKNELPKEISYAQIRAYLAMQDLGISAEGTETNVNNAIKKKVYPVPNHKEELASVRSKALKMWHGDGVSVQKIAASLDFPGKSHPSKGQTVFEYILNAAKEGCRIDWTRFCEEIGLTRELSTDIHGAILKVGSRDRLRPIKDELPKEISYAQIKAYLTMQDLGISAEGTDTNENNASTKNVYPVPNLKEELAAVRFKSLKMWHGDGLSVQKIAASLDFPGKSHPRKEQTVAEYILDAAKEGCRIDWTRFCEEIGLTCELSTDIQGAILKVGSRDRLKPIKNELPKEISYAQIRAYLTMQDLGISSEGTETNVNNAITKKEYLVPNHKEGLAAVRFKALKMWHGDCVSVQKIAASLEFPGKSHPRKEQTVAEYILDAAKEGCRIDWTRFCEEIGLTRELSADIQGAILKVGSRDRLKPIKDELPKEISYAQIRAYLTMQDLGISSEGTETNENNAITKKEYLVPNHKEGLAAVRFKALKMWHGDGVSVQKIAASLDFPSKSHPIKEKIVVDYIVDAAKEGCRIDWTRFCEEIGMTCELSTDIQGAILKVGSRDRLKPIKDEIPKEISYAQIRAYLTMQDLGISAEGTDTNENNASTKNVYPVPNLKEELAAVRIKALKMWHGDGVSVQKIAASLDFPGESHPRKEQTVVDYILDAAKEGCKIDWTRFCEEIGLTRELCIDIQGAILEVGSSDVLEPIKNELPEDISYDQIKAYLTMQDLGISAEGTETNVHNAITKNVYQVPHHKEELAVVRFKALKMWVGDGLSVQKIAASFDLPGESHPRKEQTVVEYILDAAKEGWRIDWTRFCEEIGLTRELSADIQGAILEVGSRDILEPIKNKLPEEISYAQIKAYLTMQDLRISAEGTPPSHQTQG
ncbi:uncharacterized protein LOC132269237 isoform X2 [Cornus florida]|nr:uncharacterized protein LOC132269237 isoform X2 [Cornus florida]